MTLNAYSQHFHGSGYPFRGRQLYQNCFCLHFESGRLSVLPALVAQLDARPTGDQEVAGFNNHPPPPPPTSYGDNLHEVSVPIF